MRGYWETVVIGAGPVGMMAALAAARRGSTLLAVRRRRSPEPPRIDVVPAPLLALLLEFGVHPAVLGVRALHDTRLVSWEHAEPEILRGPATAHVERSALEQALAALVGRTKAIETRTCSSFPPGCATRLLIDATGRRAVSARRRVGPEEPWIARTFWLPCRFTLAAQAFRMAALAEGYAYRLGTADCIMLGFVGIGTLVKRTPDEIEQSLDREGAGWLLAGLPHLTNFDPGRGGMASAQWSEGKSTVVRVGDAELARDALAAQGLATGISDALQIALAPKGAAFSERRREQRERHIATLLATIGRCRFHGMPAWSRYKDFLLTHAELRA